MSSSINHKPPHPDSLDDVLEQSWSALVRAVRDRKHPYHLPVLATVDEQEQPQARTVVLRGADPKRLTLACHTDARSPKHAQLLANPRACFAFYDAKSSVQLRVSGVAALAGVENSDEAREAWERASDSSRECYMGPLPPSSRAEQPMTNLPEVDAPGNFDAAALAMGRANFRRVTLHVDRLGWLRLRHDGHRRACFEWAEGRLTARTWLAP